MCQGDTVGVEVNGAQDYVWTDIGAIVTDDLAFDTVGVVTEFDVTLEVLGTDIWGCSNVDYLDITVTDSPAPTVSGPGTACVGDAMTFVAQEPDGAVLEWVTAPGGPGDVPLELEALPGVFPVTVMATNAVGCTAATPG